MENGEGELTTMRVGPWPWTSHAISHGAPRWAPTVDTPDLVGLRGQKICGNSG